jgi:hypothetical protein
MEPEKALEAMDESLYRSLDRHFSDTERDIFLKSWMGDTYEKMVDKEMAEPLQYAAGYLSRTIGPRLWASLSQILGEEVKKTNFKGAVMRYIEAKESGQQADSSPFQESYEGVLPVYSEELEPCVNEKQLESLESTGSIHQEMLCGIEVEKFVAEDLTQKARKGGDVKQKLCKNVKGKSFKFGSLTQEA